MFLFLPGAVQVFKGRPDKMVTYLISNDIGLGNYIKPTKNSGLTIIITKD